MFYVWPMPPTRLKAAQAMRKAPASTERFLWNLLRNRQLGDLKFRRQVPIGPYIADFVCLRHRLIVEADGYWHDADADAKRDGWLYRQGFRVLRFANAEITSKPNEVLAAIMAATSLASGLAPKRSLLR
jgi:very-short-patch-repair endonuclease